MDEFHFRRELTFVFEEDQKRFHIWGQKDVSPERGPRTAKMVGEVYIDSKSAVFPTLIRLTVAGDREPKIMVAFHELFDLLRTKNS